MNSEDLNAIWQKVEYAYMDERINSERALQAIIYGALVSIMPLDSLVLVEPVFPSNLELGAYIPDLVVLNRRTKVIECFFEIKCAPHFWFTESGIRHDLDKLQTYSGLIDSPIEVDVFGPNRVLDNNGVWIGGRPKYRMVQDTLVAFMILARRNNILDRKKIIHPIVKQKNFVLLAGCTEPKEENFSVQWYQE